jgi:hypothetical protein
MRPKPSRSDINAWQSLGTYNLALDSSVVFPDNVQLQARGSNSDNSYRFEGVVNVKRIYFSFTFMWPCIVTNFFVINQLDVLIFQIYFGMKLYMFRTVSLSITRTYSLYTQQWYMSYKFVDSFRAGSGWNILILLLLESCLQSCMTYTIAGCTVSNSWWWTEKLSETYRVSFQNKCGKLVRPVGLLQRKIFIPVSRSLQTDNLCLMLSPIALYSGRGLRAFSTKGMEVN